MDFSVKDVPPPVPLKTYQWEDLRRDKERGKYPYTYLSKNLLLEQDHMTEDDKKPLVSAEAEKPEDEQKKTKVVERRKEDIHTTKEETERSENKEEKTISDQNERITMRQDSTDDIEIKYQLLVEAEPLDQTDRMSVISKADSKKRESEDTNGESNIEQYFDTEEISKSTLDTSGLEVGTAVSNAGFVHDSIHDCIPSVSETLAVPQEHERKHSGSSEGTKSNLSLFEKIKNSKFKAPTFAMPQVKKLTFHKKGSKRVKNDSNDQKFTVTEVRKSEVTVQRRTCESPVYIYIPLKPTAEDLEKERQDAMKSESHRRLASDSRSERLNGSKDTNGTVSSTSKNVDVQSVSSKWNGRQSKIDKKSKGTRAKEALPTSEMKTSPVTKKRDDSPVEYIYIPLKPPENETWHKPSSGTERSFDKVEAVNTKLIYTETQVSVVTKVDKQVVKEEEEIITESEKPQKSEIEIKQLPTVISKPDQHKTKGAIKKKPDDKGKNINDKTTKFTKDIKKLVSKLKGQQTKTKPGGSSLKTASEQTSVEKKTSPIGKNHDDSPVEYIYIPLKGPLPHENPEQAEVKRKENISTKPEIQGVTVAIVEKEKPSLMGKFKGPKTEEKSPPAIKKSIQQFTGKRDSPKSPKKESVNKKSSPLMPSVKSNDSPVEYIYIPLKPLQSEVSEELLKCTDDKAEGTLMELKASKENSKLEIEQKPREALINPVAGNVTKLEKVPDKPKERQKDNIMTKLKGLKQKKAQAPKSDVKTNKEQVSEKMKSPPKDLKSSDAPVEYIYIPLKPPAETTIPEESVGETTVSEIVAQSSSLPLEEPQRRKIDDNSEEARLIKEAVIRQWQGFKTKPLQKPMPLKRTEPKMTSVVFGSGESPVEYIYIPLNPTEEQLEYERAMKEQKRLASSPARTSKCSDKSNKAAVKTGAIKKQPTEKSNTIKDTTTRLTEDIKKFASKLKDMQKKSKKPTFTTFKHGSKSNSKRMSPTTSKKPVDSRSPPTPRQHEDTPVEYIFIPLKGPQTTEETLKERGKDIEEVTTSITSELGDRIEEADKKSSILEGPHYELLTKEDEEDGLKTAIIDSLNEMKPRDEVLKTEDSPKLNRRLSIESLKMEEVENGLDKSHNRDENAIYEDAIQTKDEEPDTSVSTSRKLVTVAVDEQMIKDSSLEDDHNKWSKSTLLAVC